MWPFSRASREECDRARRACASKSSALRQCVAINGERACEGLTNDYDACRASRVGACKSAAEAFEKCARRSVNWMGSPEDLPTCEGELRVMRRCLRRRWKPSAE